MAMSWNTKRRVRVLSSLVVAVIIILVALDYFDIIDIGLGL